MRRGAHQSLKSCTLRALSCSGRALEMISNMRFPRLGEDQINLHAGGCAPASEGRTVE